METSVPIGNYPNCTHLDINLPECGLRFVPKVYNISYDQNKCFGNQYSPKILYDIERNNLFFEKKSTEGRIYEGTQVAWGESPWTVQVTNEVGVTDYGWCTGSLITFEWVLTAAHCGEGWYVLHII